MEMGEVVQDTGCKSNVLSLPSKCDEDFIAFSDIPIMKVLINEGELVKDAKYESIDMNDATGTKSPNELISSTNEILDHPMDEVQITSVVENCSQIEVDSIDSLANAKSSLVNLAVESEKPMGSAYVSIKMRLNESSTFVKANVCVDTGADFTVCDQAFLKKVFGNEVLKHLHFPHRLPKLRSASGHNLKLLGKIKLVLLFGEYEMELDVLVHEGDICIFLLGSDSFYDNLIYDRGKYLAFADCKYPPIPIRYELVRDIVNSIGQFRIAPRSSALVPVKVSDNTQFTGKEVILYPINEVSSVDRQKCCEFHTLESGSLNLARNSISTIDSSGNAYVLVENTSDDILTILPGTELARVELVSEDNDSDGQINHVVDSSEIPGLVEKGKWPISALKGELSDKLPSNIVVQWDKLYRNHDRTTNGDEAHKSEGNVNYVHDKQERKDLLDGTGEGFPTPPAADSIHPDQDDLGDQSEAWLTSVEHQHLSDSDWNKLRDVLIRNQDAFAKSKTEIGCCNYFKVDLPLKPGTGYLYNKPRPLPHKHREMANETISELLAKGVIRPSKSPHATNIVCVKKKTVNGVISHRICVDLRQVNENSIPNRFPNFWIEDAMSKIQGAVFRTAMDFKDAFHMLVLTEESIPVTAFYFNNVLFEYVRVPFGHVCAMNAFCCLMALLCVGYEPASYYADDLMITTKAEAQLSRDQLYDKHLSDIEGMLTRIIDAGLKLTAHKCQWAFGADTPMDWLGFTMENNLLKPQESKVAAMKEFPIPTTSKQVISFIATASFYRRFIKSFAKEVQPMFNVAYTEPFKWTPEAQEAFEKVKEIMCSDLVLRLPRQGEPFQIYSDASAGALGVVLCQVDPIDHKQHPCAYGSRKFNASEVKLSIPCKELLAIVYGLNLWSYYICGNPIQVYSDCRAWTFLKMQSGASGKISRLALLVSEYDISISYVKGTLNKAADGLSRAHEDGLTKYDDLITARHPALEFLGAPELPAGELLKLNDYLEQCDGYLTEHWPKVLKEYEAYKLSKGENPDLENLNQKLSPAQQKLSNEAKDALIEAEYVNQVIQEAAILHYDRSNTGNWNQKLRKDKIYPFRLSEEIMSEGYQSGIPEHIAPSDSDPLSDSEVPPSDEEDMNTTDSSFKAAIYNIKLVAINESVFSIPAFIELQANDEFCSRKIGLIKGKDVRTKSSGYFLKRNILMRQMETKDLQYYSVLCIPQILIKPLLESSHRSLLSGHFGGERYALNMARKYYWPKMKDSIMDFHRSCLPCQYNDKYPIRYSSGYVIRPKWPMHVVHCDLIVGLPRALDGSYAILLLYDGFSRLTFGIPLTSEKADYVVKKLMSHFVAAFGLPWALHSDNGRNVDGSLIRHLAVMLGVLKTSTPPYTPNANPTETMCGAVSMLIRKALNASDKRYWSLCLPFILNALNSTVHTATGYTPNSLFFGRYKERDPVPLVPFDASSANVNEYFQKMRRFQELAFQIVRSRNERKLQANKDKWDLTAKIHSYKEGDFVLVKNNAPASGPGKMKLRAKYIGPFRVIKAYTSSLILVPWSENSRLEEYYKDPNLFRLMHRGDIRPFQTRQAAVKHCKPFRGKLDAEEIIDPIMLTRFLDMLGVDSQEDLLSVIDPRVGPGPPASNSNDTDPSSLDDGNPRPDRPPIGNPPRPPSSHGSSDSDPGDNPNPAGLVPDPDPVPEPEHVGDPDPNLGGPDLPDPGPQPDFDNEPAEADFDNEPAEETPRRRDHVVIGSEIARRRRQMDKEIFSKTPMSHKGKALLKARAKKYATTHITDTHTQYDRRMRELELLSRNSYKDIRDNAQREMRELKSQYRAELGMSESDTSGTLEKSSDDSSETGNYESARDSLPETSLRDMDLDDDPTLEWDHEQPLDSPMANPQRISIRTPGVHIDIGPTGSRTRTPKSRAVAKTPKSRASAKSPFRPARTPRGRNVDDVEDWLETVRPQADAGASRYPLDEFGSPIITTRYGRVIRTPQRYGDNIDKILNREERELARALELSKETAARELMAKRSTKVARSPEAGFSGTQRNTDHSQQSARSKRTQDTSSRSAHAEKSKGTKPGSSGQAPPTAGSSRRPTETVDTPEQATEESVFGGRPNLARTPPPSQTRDDASAFGRSSKLARTPPGSQK